MRPLPPILPSAPWAVFPSALGGLPLQAKLSQMPLCPGEVYHCGTGGGPCSPLVFSGVYALPSHSGSPGDWRRLRTQVPWAQASDYFVLCCCAIHRKPSKTPSTGPAPPPEPHIASVHSTSDLHRRPGNQKKGGLAHHRRVVNESSTF